MARLIVATAALALGLASPAPAATAVLSDGALTVTGEPTPSDLITVSVAPNGDVTVDFNSNVGDPDGSGGSACSSDGLRIVCIGAAVDSITIDDGGGASDVLGGSSRAESFLTRDGQPDTVNCGGGADTVTADAVDSVAADCETILGDSDGDGVPDARDRCPLQPAATADGCAAAPVQDVTAPGLSAIALSSASFKPPRGTTIFYRLDEAATVTFSVERAAKGRRVRGKCRKVTRRNRKRRRCIRYVAVKNSAFTHAGTVGDNSLTFSGVVSGRPLRPGSYRLVVIAEDPSGNRSAPVRRKFRVRR